MALRQEDKVGWDYSGSLVNEVYDAVHEEGLLCF